MYNDDESANFIVESVAVPPVLTPGTRPEISMSIAYYTTLPRASSSMKATAVKGRRGGSRVGAEYLLTLREDGYFVKRI